MVVSGSRIQPDVPVSKVEQVEGKRFPGVGVLVGVDDTAGVGVPGGAVGVSEICSQVL